MHNNFDNTILCSTTTVCITQLSSLHYCLLFLKGNFDACSNGHQTVLSQKLKCGWPKTDACHHCVGEQGHFVAMGVQHCCGLDEPVMVGVRGCEAGRNSNWHSSSFQLAH